MRNCCKAGAAGKVPKILAVIRIVTVGVAVASGVGGLFARYIEANVTILIPGSGLANPCAGWRVTAGIFPDNVGTSTMLTTAVCNFDCEALFFHHATTKLASDVELDKP